MLAEVRFLGGPPSSPATFANYGIPPKTGTITTYIPYKYRQQWWQYAAGYDPDLPAAAKEELIKLKGTTFSSTYATTPSKRLLLLESMPPGLVVIIR